MANTVKNQPGEPGVEKIVVEENHALDNIQSGYEQNKKRINTAVTAVLAVVVGFFAYQKLYKEPNENKAANAMSYAQQSFQIDSVNKALNGDGQHMGFAKIAKKYSGTKSGNLANYYAGVCYLQMGDAPNAVKYLKEFDGDGTNLKLVASGNLGDAYMEQGKVKEGIDSYMAAASDKENTVLTPLYLYRAALAMEMNNQADKAKDAYKRIRDEYPQSMQARETDKNLARMGELN
jgi:tetratricopeptide (TPR) repeat protein